MALGKNCLVSEKKPGSSFAAHERRCVNGMLKNMASSSHNSCQENASACGNGRVQASVGIPGLGDFQPSSNVAIKREFVDENDENVETGASENVSVKMVVESDSNSGTPPPRKKRRSNKKGLGQPKNPLMVLNELKPGLKFEIVAQSGQPHALVFGATVVVDGNTFQGTGSSKQKAKHGAAEAVLRSMVQFRVPEESQIRRIGPGDTDFTADTASNLVNAFGGEGADVPGTPDDPMTSTAVPVARKARISLADGGKHPVQLLNEVCPGCEFVFLGESGTIQDREFIFKVSAEGKEFKASGRNKKKARANAAAKALLSLFGVRTFVSPSGEPTSDLRPRAQVGPGAIPPPMSTQLPQEVADSIAEVTMDKFRLLQDQLGDQLSRRKVLAGVVMTDMSDGGSDIKYTVISIGTGTKLISGEYMSDRGLAVNDCHGEIIARRSLQMFLYLQLDLASQDSGTGSIFEKKESGLYAVRKGIDFHLYINTSPCGDARVFSPHEVAPSEETDKHPCRKNRGLLRVKLENGEGTIPSINAGTPTQTWDGIQGGEKLRTMSCSDKICKWNVVGIQGALMSNFVEPIYLRSIVLGSLYHYEHLSRALYQRLGQIENLPTNYRQSRPYMNQITSPEPRVTGNAPNTSVNWSCTEQECEAIVTKQGKVGDEMQPSRLCKQRMFTRFVPLWSKLKPNKALPQSYQEAKEAAHDYQAVKMLMCKAFKQNGLGSWVEKPVEQDLFGLTG